MPDMDGRGAFLIFSCTFTTDTTICKSKEFLQHFCVLPCSTVYIFLKLTVREVQPSVCRKVFEVNMISIHGRS